MHADAVSQRCWIATHLLSREVETLEKLDLWDNVVKEAVVSLNHAIVMTVADVGKMLESVGRKLPAGRRYYARHGWSEKSGTLVGTEQGLEHLLVLGRVEWRRQDRDNHALEPRVELLGKRGDGHALLIS